MEEDDESYYRVSPMDEWMPRARASDANAITKAESHSSSSKPLTNSRHAAASQRYSGCIAWMAKKSAFDKCANFAGQPASHQPARRKRTDAKVLLVPGTGQPKKKRKIK